MSTVMDLGWCMARCSITHEEAELTIVEPASEGDAAISMTLIGIEAITALRNCIDEEIARLGERADLENEDVPQ